MRLIHAKTLSLREFFDNALPYYAILSHTWGHEEVTFADMQSGSPTAKEGFNKIRLSCNQALLDGFDYIWIDTCCIDKSSSAELSEAINSMFKWYEKADICYVYLQDYEANLEQLADQYSNNFRAFSNCRWFTRGWTLQELIAPTQVAFFDESWVQFGSNHSLCKQLCSITGVDEEVLRSQKSLFSVSIARRMSWASKRNTTRSEDVAYCLLGIFGVNMPLLYGEGNKAFIRLVEQIIKDSDDHSIFAWKQLVDGERSWDAHRSGLLPESPKVFADSGRIVPYQTSGKSLPYTMTNKGLEIVLDVVDQSRVDKSSFGFTKVLLNCWESARARNRVGLFIEAVEDDQCVRARNTLLTFDKSLDYTSRKMFVKQNVIGTHMHARRNGIQRTCHIQTFTRFRREQTFLDRVKTQVIPNKSRVLGPREYTREPAGVWSPGIVAMVFQYTTLYIILGLDQTEQTFCLLGQLRNKEEYAMNGDLAADYAEVAGKCEQDLRLSGWARSQTYRHANICVDITARMETRSTEHQIEYCVWIEGDYHPNQAIPRIGAFEPRWISFGQGK